MTMGSTQRPVRIANCSGAEPDPGHHMYNQAKCKLCGLSSRCCAEKVLYLAYVYVDGQVDVITGDYLAGGWTVHIAWIQS